MEIVEEIATMNNVLDQIQKYQESHGIVLNEFQKQVMGRVMKKYALMLPPKDIGNKLTTRDRKDANQTKQTLKILMDKKSRDVDITAALMGG